MSVRQTLSVTAEMIKRIEKTFGDHVRDLVKKADPPSKRRRTVSTAPLALENDHKEIPLFTKAFEDSMMRAPNEDEQSCSRGEECECHSMATIDPAIDSSLAFVGVAVLDGLCVLCLRCQTSQLFYEFLVSNAVPSNVIQKHRNDIEKKGEYSKNFVHLPDTFRGIISPVVMHQRNKYSYENGKIVQNNLDFQMGLSTTVLFTNKHC